MDRKSRRSVAVTAGLAAVLALSPVVAPAVTAQAQDGDSTRMEQSTETISITFVYCDGTDGSEVRTYDKGNKIINNKPTLEREGYKFGGWYSDPEYSESSKLDILSATATVDMTLYAKWNKNPTLTFYNEISYENMDGVDAYLVVVHEYDDSFKKPDNPSIPVGYDAEEYVFDGWFSDPSLDEEYRLESTDWGKGFTKDTNLYAKWVKKPLVEYYVSGESKEPVYSNLVEPGTASIESTEAKKHFPEWTANYEFEGWYADPSYSEESKYNSYQWGQQGGITEDTKLYAKFKTSPVVIFDYQVEGIKEATVTINLGDYIDSDEVPAAPERDGYELVGWYTNEACTEGSEYNFDTPVTGDTTLYAKWTEIKYAQVTFDYNAPDGDDTITKVKVGDSAAKPADPTRTGYDFAGWYTDEDCTQAYNFDVPVTGDLTLYAKWTPKQFTVTFEDGVEGNDVVSSTVSYGEKVVEPDDPTRVGYDFAGWFTDEACTKAYDFAAPVTDNMTLYAKWTPVVDPDPEPTPDPEPETKTFSVTLNDGLADTEDQVITIAEGETIDSSAIKAPTYDGWTFVGWFTDSDLTQEWDFSTPVTSDMTLWAGWLRNDVDGSGVTDDTETTTDDVEKDANKAEKDNDPAVPDTGDATVAVYGIAAVGAALTGAGALIRRRR